MQNGYLTVITNNGGVRFDTSPIYNTFKRTPDMKLSCKRKKRQTDVASKRS